MKQKWCVFNLILLKLCYNWDRLNKVNQHFKWKYKFIYTVENDDLDEDYDIQNGTKNANNSATGTFIVDEESANVAKDMGKMLLFNIFIQQIW